MFLTRQLPAASSKPPSDPGIVTLGNFDGVHRGHQALLAAMQARAVGSNGNIHVITFDPHPRNYFASLGIGAPVTQLCSIRQRLEQLRTMGADHVHLLRFNTAMANLSAHEFVLRAMVVACNAKQVFVGKDVRFGHKREGDLNLLRQLGQHYGFDVQVIEDCLSSASQRVSSTAVRQAIKAHDLHTAQQLMGRTVSISGRVIHGKKIGRTLGCPTLNLDPRMKNPALKGIYVVAVQGLPKTAQALWGVASLGLRPTVEKTDRYSLEVHVFDWTGNAYGQRVTVQFLHQLRDEAAYVDLPTLQLAIEQDMRDARTWTQSHPNALNPLPGA